MVGLKNSFIKKGVKNVDYEAFGPQLALN